ncbi:hypothetical protein MESS4_350005 [Mesorhizobium sp. STM 4661]|nr:hypothetical protein MESS4_350005 [Mesorhizobium sp. STM 4661]
MSKAFDFIFFAGQIWNFSILLGIVQRGKATLASVTRLLNQT